MQENQGRTLVILEGMKDVDAVDGGGIVSVVDVVAACSMGCAIVA
jgi:hypothetical protein